MFSLVKAFSRELIPLRRSFNKHAGFKQPIKILRSAGAFRLSEIRINPKQLPIHSEMDDYESLGRHISAMFQA